MNKETHCLLLFGLMVCFAPLNAQSWRSSVYPSNWEAPDDSNFYTDKMVQDFSFAGYHLGELAIPDVQNNVIDVTSAGYDADKTGVEDVTAILQRAIHDAGLAGGGVVYLPEGIYNVSPGSGNDFSLSIRNSNIILRGDGPGKTFLINSSSQMRSKAIISVNTSGSWYSTGPNSTNITKDLMKPTSIIPVQSVSGYQVGDLVIVRNSISDAWIKEHKMSKDWGGFGSKLNGLIYCRAIVDINESSNELIIDIPIRYALKVSDQAKVYKAPAMLSEVGIEHLSIGNQQSNINSGWDENDFNTSGSGAYNCHEATVIRMESVMNSWVQNVSTFQPEGNTSDTHILSNGIKLIETKNVTLRNCNFKSPQYGGGGGNGYMYRIMANETLIEGCTAEFSRHGFVLSHMRASGNVFRGCSDLDSGVQRGLSGNEEVSGSGSDHHMHFSHSNLFDECTVTNSTLDAYWRKWGGTPMHGITAAHSVYWNTTSNGNQSYAVRTQQGRYGYAIGSKGNKSALLTTPHLANSESMTAPVDHVEGEGNGENLIPQSLYKDQFQKRIKGSVLGLIKAIDLQNDKETNQLSVYPNPVRESFVVDLSGYGKSTLHIYSFLGGIVHSEIAEGKVEINKSEKFNPGMYLLWIQDVKGKIYTRKLLME